MSFINFLIFLLYGIFLYIAVHKIHGTKEGLEWLGMLFISMMYLGKYCMSRCVLSNWKWKKRVILRISFSFVIVPCMLLFYSLWYENLSWTIFGAGIVTGAIINLDRYFSYIYVVLFAVLADTAVEVWVLHGKVDFIYLTTLTADQLALLFSCAAIYIILYKTELENIQKKLYLTDLSSKDTLTSLYNRSYLEWYFEEKKASGLRALLILDLDNFKTVNDVLGHNEGDLVLMQVSKILKEHFRETGCVARLGGDEFAVVSSELQDKEAYEKRVQQLQEHFPICVGANGCIRVTLSIGVIFVEDDCSFQEAYRQADALMYESKKSGKNTQSFGNIA